MPSKYTLRDIARTAYELADRYSDGKYHPDDETWVEKLYRLRLSPKSLVPRTYDYARAQISSLARNGLHFFDPHHHERSH